MDPNSRPQLPPDLMRLDAQSTDLAALRDRARLLIEAETMAGRRCSCGNRIWSKGIRAFGFYIGQIPRAVAGMNIPMGNIAVTGVYCSTGCPEYKRALVDGLMFPGSEHLGKVKISGYERLPVMHWIEGRVDEHPED